MTLSRCGLIVLTSLLPLNSCFWGADRSEKNIAGNYWLRADDDANDYHLYYDNQGEFGSSLIQSRVAAAGYNERVVIIKSCAGYYIIPLKSIQHDEMETGIYNNVQGDIRRKMLGPFTRATFNKNLAAIEEDSLVTFNQLLADCQ
ncbi:hypothetical protein [Hymenobacter lucidus]|uniref:Lipoprotein n=1 Tax=Hymenobacter lucidus TaxID=2880930 RepID=A0ABS8AUA5_9BACT|nr:hypothetical protein [Hymenobacter lucidus]MCB2409324.1 hypothetical protein [Hymenobacter lucidus]